MLIRFEAVGRKIIRGRTVQMVCASESEAKHTAYRLNEVALKVELEEKKKKEDGK